MIFIAVEGAEHCNALRAGPLIDRLVVEVTRVAPWLGAERKLPWRAI